MYLGKFMGRTCRVEFADINMILTTICCSICRVLLWLEAVKNVPVFIDLIKLKLDLILVLLSVVGIGEHFIFSMYCNEVNIVCILFDILSRYIFILRFKSGLKS